MFRDLCGLSSPWKLPDLWCWQEPETAEWLPAGRGRVGVEAQLHPCVSAILRGWDWPPCEPPTPIYALIRLIRIVPLCQMYILNVLYGNFLVSKCNDGGK